MKINAIKKECLGAGFLFILNVQDGEQWIGCGSAYWPTQGPLLEQVGLEEAVCS